MEIYPLRTANYLRIRYRLPGMTQICPLAAVRLRDGKCFVDDPSRFVQLRATYQDNPFRVLFPSQCPITWRAFQTPNYLRLTYQLPGESWGRPVAALRRSDGTCFVDEPEVFEQIRRRSSGNPFLVLFPRQNETVRRRFSAQPPYGADDRDDEGDEAEQFYAELDADEAFAAEPVLDDADDWELEWREEWYDYLEESQEQEAYWQDSDYN